MKKLIPLFVIMFLPLIFQWQGSMLLSQNLDSLKLVFSKSKEDTNKVKTSLRIARLYLNVQVDSLGKYSEFAYQLSNKLSYALGKGRANHFLGNYYFSKGNSKKAIEALTEELSLLKNEINKFQIASIYGNMAIIYQEQGQLEKALELYFKALKMEEEMGNKEGVARNLGNMGSIYMFKKDLSKAFENFTKSYQISKEINDIKNQATNLCNIASVHYERFEFQKSLDNYQLALAISKQIGDVSTIETTYINIGTIYMFIGDSLQKHNEKIKANPYYSQALQYFTEAMKMAKQIGDIFDITNAYGYLGELYHSLHMYPKSEDYLKKSLAGADTTGDINLIKLQHLALSNLYVDMNKSELALFHYKKYIATRDSIFNEENTKKAVRLEMNFDFDKKLAATQLEQEKREAVAAAENKRHKIVIYCVCGILIIVIVFAIYAVRSFLQKKKANIEITRQKEIIEEKQKEILDSIYYAKRIQQALLTSEMYIERNLNELNKKS